MISKIKNYYQQLSRKQKLFLLITVIIVFTLSLTLGNEPASDSEVSVYRPAVSLTSLSELSTTQMVSVLGTVRPVGEVELIPEKSGRVTRVNVGLGQTVAAGQIIVELENAAERASLLQAEGAYEATLAGAAQNEISVVEAEKRLENTYRSVASTNQSAYNTFRNILLNTVDEMFSGVNTNIIGLRINGRDQTLSLNAERLAFQELMPNWQAQLGTGDDANEEFLLSASRDRLVRLEKMVNSFVTLLSDDRNTTGFEQSYVTGLAGRLSGAKTELVAAITNINNTELALEQAKDTLNKAQITASGGNVSLTDAQAKQARGTLLAAQANYAKTLIRTPISGQVQTLDVKLGSFVSTQSPVARITNTSSLEVVAFLSDSELAKVSLGDVVEWGSGETGRIAAIAPTIDSVSKKTEIRVITTSTSTKAGDTLRLNIKVTESDSLAIKKEVPLTAVKLIDGKSYLLTVNDDRIKPIAVTIGLPRSGAVAVESEIDPDLQFVIDARGLNEGDQVTVRN